MIDLESVGKTCSPIPRPILRLKSEEKSSRRNKRSVSLKLERTSPKKRALDKSDSSCSQPVRKRANSSSEAPRGGALPKLPSFVPSPAAVDESVLNGEPIISPRRISKANASPVELKNEDYSLALREVSSQSLDISVDNLWRYHEASTPCCSETALSKGEFLCDFQGCLHKDTLLLFRSVALLVADNPQSPAPYRSSELVLGELADRGALESTVLETSAQSSQSRSSPSK